jgi:hypothetical protein
VNGARHASTEEERLLFLRRIGPGAACDAAPAHPKHSHTARQHPRTEPNVLQSRPERRGLETSLPWFASWLTAARRSVYLAVLFLRPAGTMKIILGNRLNNNTDDPLNPESQDDDKEK